MGACQEPVREARLEFLDTIKEEIMSHFSIDIAADRALDLAIEKVENMAMSAVTRGLIMRGVVPPSTDPDVAREDLINKMAVELFEKELERPGPHG